MQIGSRWMTGEAPPTSLSDAIRAALSRCDSETIQELGSAAASQMAWTLTWLERRPVCTHDSGVVVTEDSEGAAIIRRTDEFLGEDREDSDDWLK